MASGALTLAFTRHAWGAPVRVEVSCSQLDPEAVAAFETRALVELTLRGAASELSLQCDGEEAIVRLSPVRGKPRQRTIPITSDLESPAQRAAFVDTLVGAVWAMAGDQDAPAPPVPPPARNAENPVLPPVPNRGPSVELFVGADIETWQAGFGAGLGPRAGLSLVASEAAAFSLGGACAWGASPIAAIRATQATAMVTLDIRLGGAHKPFEVGGGLMVGGFFASATDPLSPTKGSALDAAVLARARYALTIGPLRLALGPEARAYVVRPVVAIDHREASGIPRFTIGAALELAANLWGTR